ncbi:hypothetical protein D0621_24275 [Salmonella enterica]|nr:hypothetical protein [Salmonella enterica]
MGLSSLFVGYASAESNVTQGEFDKFKNDLTPQLVFNKNGAQITVKDAVSELGDNAVKQQKLIAGMAEKYDARTDKLGQDIKKANEKNGERFNEVHQQLTELGDNAVKQQKLIAGMAEKYDARTDKLGQDIKKANEKNGERFNEVHQQLTEQTTITVPASGDTPESTITVKDAVSELGDNAVKQQNLIAAQGKRIDYLDKKINENSKKIKRSAAQSAALTGLFQPYNVGKFSASVAVGGFSDQQAVAIGAGYRFNENVAAKTGIAFSEKDSSWNMGINFEF